MIKGRVALITGSVGGIGFEIAKAFAKNGATIVLNGLLDQTSVNHQLQTIEHFGVSAMYIKADLSQPNEIHQMVDDVLERFGKVDIVVNNAVTRHDALFEELHPEHWNDALAVNLSAPYHLLKRLLPGMKERNWGRIINMASIFGVGAMAGRADYVITKHAIVGMTKVIALECADFNITCNALCPGAVETPTILDIVKKRAHDKGQDIEEFTKSFLEARQPSRRFVKPESVAALALFLCSEAARDMTGTPIPMDGGWQARA